MTSRLVGSRKRSDVGTQPPAARSACARRRRLLPGRGAGPWLARSGSPETAAAASSAYPALRTMPVLRSSSARAGAGTDPKSHGAGVADAADVAVDAAADGLRRAAHGWVLHEASRPRCWSSSLAMAWYVG